MLSEATAVCCGHPGRAPAMRGKLCCRLLAQAATSAGDHSSDRAHGSHTGGDRQHWQELHGAVCVTKPIAPAELWEALHQALVCARHVTPASPQHTTPEAQDGRSLRVLLAEDNAINQRLTVRLLEKRGHTVTVVQDGTEALAALRRQMFDVVLMDIQMPCMDGLETTQAIRARAGHRDACPYCGDDRPCHAR